MADSNPAWKDMVSPTRQAHIPIRKVSYFTFGQRISKAEITSSAFF